MNPQELKFINNNVVFGKITREDAEDAIRIMKEIKPTHDVLDFFISCWGSQKSFSVSLDEAYYHTDSRIYREGI